MIQDNVDTTAVVKELGELSGADTEMATVDPLCVRLPVVGKTLRPIVLANRETDPDPANGSAKVLA